MAERSTDGPPTLGSALGIALRAYAEEHGKVRRGDKRPAYARPSRTASPGWPYPPARPGTGAPTARWTPPGAGI
ncbi:hypothetical protein ACFWA5_46055 [Streptomyces mirabilis]|uniref:hypothetical protein n=1 Tax=Streptomyces mirabilis TaxID=68239 RepID=UPI003657436D